MTQKADFFKDFKINAQLVDRLTDRKITNPTLIQQEVIPKILKGKDVIGQSRTGSGKTLAYVIPLLDLLPRDQAPVLVLAPTKELATQIYQEIKYYSHHAMIRSMLLISGIAQEQQARELKREDKNFLIGVPGRVLKLVEAGSLKLSRVKKIVLDEADFLIDLGFKNDLETIFNRLKNLSQVMVFSATLSNKTKKLLNMLENQKYAIRIHPKNSLPQGIKNHFFPIQKDEEREKLLLSLLSLINPYLAIIFTRTKRESNWLFKLLKEKKMSVGCLNGDLSNSQRKKYINDFKKAKIQYLIATDLASRGLDFESITHIINYSLPLNELDYLHRAGRTGRMNEEGMVYSICNELDEGYLKKYAVQLDFKLYPLKIQAQQIVPYPAYQGVKPRFNINEKKEKIKREERVKKNESKKKRNRSK